VESYDCGRLLNADELEAQKEKKRIEEADEKRNAEQRKAELLQARSTAQAKRDAETQVKVIQFQMQQASNGLPSFQYAVSGDSD